VRGVVGSSLMRFGSVDKLGRSRISHCREIWARGGLFEIISGLLLHLYVYALPSYSPIQFTPMRLVSSCFYSYRTNQSLVLLNTLLHPSASS